MAYDAESKKFDAATDQILLAEAQLRQLAEKVRSYPEAAERLSQVTAALGLAATSLRANTVLLEQNSIAFRSFAADVIRRLDALERRQEHTQASIDTLSDQVQAQTPLLERASKKRGLVF